MIIATRNRLAVGLLALAAILGAVATTGGSTSTQADSIWGLVQVDPAPGENTGGSTGTTSAPSSETPVAPQDSIWG
ncbi:hypothetical protein [Streptomyces sp. NPDC054838]